jgi:hypothetical protein
LAQHRYQARRLTLGRSEPELRQFDSAQFQRLVAK